MTGTFLYGARGPSEEPGERQSAIHLPVTEEEGRVRAGGKAGRRTRGQMLGEERDRDKLQAGPD